MTARADIRTPYWHPSCFWPVKYEWTCDSDPNALMSASDKIMKEWITLACHGAPTNVILFYNFSSSAYGCSIAVTDLCRVWESSLTRQEVVSEAYKQSCSIDLSESTTQLRTLFLKLKQSLIEGRNELGLGEESPQQALSLRTRLKLPAPLRLLKWTFTLREQDAAEFAKIITDPLMHEASFMKHQMTSLFQLLKEKDHVLSKLLDKIDNSSTDLSHIFPGITGIKSKKNRIGIVEASKHVPGITPFDRTAWESEFNEKFKSEIATTSNFSNVLQDLESDSHADRFTTDWTEKLSSLSESLTSNNGTSESDTSQMPTRVSMNPPEKNGSEPSGDLDGSSTESDFEELNGTPPKAQNGKTKSETSSPVSDKAKSRNSPFVSSSRETADKQKMSQFQASGSTTPDLDDSDSDNAPTAAKSAWPKTALGNSKLGVIGGNKPQIRLSSSPPAQSASSRPSNLSRRLGVLGGQRGLAKSNSKPSALIARSSKIPEPHQRMTDSDTDSNPTPPPIVAGSEVAESSQIQSPKSLPQPAEEEGVEETIDERAKRKREELKVKKANAGNAKKKLRRF